MLKVGIVGLPNVGKSTLFNALTAQEAALAANYPFATIEPNVGVVPVPDERLSFLEEIYKPERVVPTFIEFVDIAGLVKGASEGAGLGNQFLANIRETNAIVQVVRCFDDDSIIHVEGSVDPLRDIQTIQIELALADLASVDKRLEKTARAAKSGNKKAKFELEVLEKIKPFLEDGKPVRSLSFEEEEKTVLKSLFLLTAKPNIYAANVDENTLVQPGANHYVRQVKQFAETDSSEVVVICAKLEAELAVLSLEERKEYLENLGVKSSGVDQLIRSAYRILGLMSFLTAGEKEVRAWTIPVGTKAPQAAGKIHSDMEKGFIKAEVISFEDLVRAGSEKAAREMGLVRLEGKEYIMQEGDVVHFKFNV